MVYSWPLNNIALNFVGSLLCEFSFNKYVTVLTICGWLNVCMWDWAQSADCEVNFRCAWIRGHLHRCKPPLTPPLFQGQLYFKITFKDGHLMKTHSIIQRCQVYFVTIWWWFPLSCPFSTFLFPACFSFYSIFFFLLPSIFSSIKVFPNESVFRIR